MSKNNDMLSKNFAVREVACRCGCGQCKIEPELIANLQVLRDEAGVPLVINSGYRCESHNRRVGGSPRSQHMHGRAVDIRPIGMSLSQLCQLAEKIPGFAQGGIGYYPHRGFLHVDVRSTPARWTEVSRGKTVLGLRYDL